MLRHNIKIAFRNFQKDKGTFLINVIGLTIGLTVSLLILSWVQFERNMDQFHEKGNQLHVAYGNIQMSDGTIETWANVPFPSADYLKQTFPEVENTAAYDFTNKKNFVVEDKEFLIDGMYATASFFELFSFPLVALEKENFFEAPNSILLSESTAQKLFGNNWQERALGEIVEIDGEKIFRVVGVYANVPQSSSIKFDFVMNLQDLRNINPASFPWGNFDSRVVMQLRKGVDIEAFRKKVASVIADNNEYSQETVFIVHPFEDQYLRGRYENGKVSGGRIEYVRIFTLCALFLLLIACINFMNLSTARASLRAKEVGVRKTIGAHRSSLIQQFMLEAGVITGLSFLLAILLGTLLLPYFQQLANQEVTINFSSSSFWGFTLGLGVVTAILAGSYPSFFLSSFKINDVLQGKAISNIAGVSLRKSLVVFQFGLSILLAVGAMLVSSQVDFLKNINLGIDKDNVMYFRTPPKAKKNFQVFENELLQMPGIQELTVSSSNPLNVRSQTDNPQWEGMLAGTRMMFSVMITDEKFADMMNVSLVEGQNFSPKAKESEAEFILNETAIEAMNLEDPIGKKMELWEEKGKIVGVVKDFHIHSLHHNIEPLILANLQWEPSLVMLKIDPTQMESVIAAVGTTFEKFAEGHPYRYDFLDERYLQMYRSENRVSQMAKWFAGIALLISCLGLFGLSAFIAEQKKKEISIRKVLGASVENVVFLLSKNFLKLVVIALIFALPLAWYFSNNWLMDFAYRIEIHWSYFLIASIMAVAIAFFTVSFHSISAALTNPSNNLNND